MTIWEEKDFTVGVVTIGCVLLLACWGVVPEARAASTFSAHSIGLFQAGGVDEDAASGATPVTVSSSVSNFNGTLEAESIAERGFVSVSGFVSASNSKGTSGTLGTFIEFQDVTIKRKDGLPSSETVEATFQYFTTFNAAWSGPVPPFSSAADMTAIASITQPGVTSFSATDIYTDNYSSGSTGTPGIETITGTLQVDTPFTLRLSIFSGGLSAGTGNFGQYDLGINAGPTGLSAGAASGAALSAVSSSVGPVFLLPEEFTVDSPEMNLFDNEWEVVPEPSAAALLVMGGMVMMIRRRK